MSFEPYKAPGMDNIIPVLLQQSLEEITGLLTGVLRGCKTKVIFIPKPGKKSYTEVKYYRPISLTSFLLKTLERLVNGYLKYRVSHGQISGNSALFGGQSH